jgi:hypothetical protein
MFYHKLKYSLQMKHLDLNERITNILTDLPYTLFLFDAVDLRPWQHCTKHGINFSTTSKGTHSVPGMAVVLLHSKPCRAVPGNPLLTVRRISNVWKSPGHIT